MRPAIWLLALGCPGPAPAVCGKMCDLLMVDCAYAAFPDPASCEQGCAYDASTGADVPALYGCLSDADCDTSAVLACSRAFGGEP